MKTLLEFTKPYSDLSSEAGSISHDGKMLAFLDKDKRAYGVGIASNGELYFFRCMERHEYSKKKWAVINIHSSAEILRHYYLSEIFPHKIGYDSKGNMFNLEKATFSVIRKPYDITMRQFGVLGEQDRGSHVILMEDGVWNVDALRVEDPNEPKVGDVCRFWNIENGNYMIGVLCCIDDSLENLAYETSAGIWFGNAEKITDPHITKHFKK